MPPFRVSQQSQFLQLTSQTFLSYLCNFQYLEIIYIHTEIYFPCCKKLYSLLWWVNFILTMMPHFYRCSVSLPLCHLHFRAELSSHSSKILRSLYFSCIFTYPISCLKVQVFGYDKNLICSQLNFRHWNNVWHLTCLVSFYWKNK